MIEPWKRQLYLQIGLNMLQHMQYIGARFAMLLYAVKLQASPTMIGVLVAVNSLLPTLTSVHMGKKLDRWPDWRPPLLIAGTALFIGVLLPYFWASISALFVMCVINGFSFNLFRLAAQQMVGRLGATADRPDNYNLHTMGVATSNVLSPIIAGFSIDNLGVAPAFLIFAVIGIVPMAAIATRQLNLVNTHPAEHAHAEHKGGSWDLLRHKPLRRVLIAGAILMSAWDIFSFMMPIFGSQLKFSASQIGICAGAFYSGTFFIRIFLRRLLLRFTQWQLLILSMVGGGVGFLAYPLMESFAVLMVVSFVLGSVLGMTQPMTMSLCYDEAPPNRKGEVIGLRVMMLHGLQIFIPVLAGSLGSAFGLQVSYWLAAATLFLGGVAAREEWHRRRTA